MCTLHWKNNVFFLQKLGMDENNSREFNNTSQTTMKKVFKELNLIFSYVKNPYKEAC
jgi:hypothetical protein